MSIRTTVNFDYRTWRLKIGGQSAAWNPVIRRPEIATISRGIIYVDCIRAVAGILISGRTGKHLMCVVDTKVWYWNANGCGPIRSQGYGLK